MGVQLLLLGQGLERGLGVQRNHGLVIGEHELGGLQFRHLGVATKSGAGNNETTDKN